MSVKGDDPMSPIDGARRQGITAAVPAQALSSSWLAGPRYAVGMFTGTAELYDRFYESKDYRGEAERVRDIVLDRRPEARTLLDVACGTGAHLAHLADSFEVDGIDLDDALLRLATRRLPSVPLHRADMRDFNLGRRFDAVTCLFSSIGYVETPDGLRRAIEAMARHLEPGGVLVVEPWITPQRFDPTVMARPIMIEAPDLQAVRLNASRVDGRRSILEFHYLVARPGSIEHLIEEHVLGLFTDDEMREATACAGLQVEHDSEGLSGRGLWIGIRG